MENAGFVAEPIQLSKTITDWKKNLNPSYNLCYIAVSEKKLVLKDTKNELA